MWIRTVLRYRCYSSGVQASRGYQSCSSMQMEHLEQLGCQSVFLLIFKLDGFVESPVVSDGHCRKIGIPGIFDQWAQGSMEIGLDRN